MTELIQVRALHDVDVSGDGRTVRGIFVPFDAPVRINQDLVEGFRSGAFDHQVRAIQSRGAKIPFANGHLAPPFNGRIVGTLTEIRNDKAGLFGEARVSDTTEGNDLLTLMRDGAVEQLSIGFLPVTNVYDNKGVTWRTKANLTELAAVPRGAYGDGARVTEIRAAHCPTCGSYERQNAALEIELQKRQIAAWMRGDLDG